MTKEGGSPTRAMGLLSITEAAPTVAQKLRFQAAIAMEKAMEAQGWNQAHLAFMAELSEGQISRLLSGESNMTLDTMARLAASMGKRVRIVVE